MAWLTDHLDHVLSILATIVHVVVVIGVLLTRQREPSAALAWILFVLLVPFVGVVAYVLLGRTRTLRAIRQSQRAEERLRHVLERYDVSARRRDDPEHAALPLRTRSLIDLGRPLSSSGASRGNRARLLRDAAETYAAIGDAIDAARDHVHVLFYIVRNDRVGRGLRAQLVRRARDGIEVRVLVDGIGSIGLPSDFWRPLEDVGGHAGVFNPVRRVRGFPRRRDRVDFRNHRKIVVVDGSTSFTGGINVGKEYLGLDPDIGHWRDTHVRIDGPASLSLQQTFIQDWLAATGEVLEDERYYPDLRDEAGEGEGDGCTIGVIDSGPDRPWGSMSLMHAHALALANERAWITNPYFVPSQTILDALTSAALRGVDVRLLLPARSDNVLVGLASRYYYRDLLDAGVRIFEYSRGFLHAKTMLVDDWMGTVGSANMDLRSFNLNFELNAFVFSAALAGALATRYEEDLEAAREITLEAERAVAGPVRLLRSSARLFAPLL